MIPQFDLIREATKSFGLPCIELQGFEADDIIATYAREAKDLGGKVTIVSSDKDLMQLVDERVSLYDAMKNKYLQFIMHLPVSYLKTILLVHFWRKIFVYQTSQGTNKIS